MAWVIENDVLRASFSELGGELQSLVAKETGIEYLWQGNAEFWGRRSPVLFPFVGRLKDDQYSYQGKTYHMGQHGFARDQRFVAKQESQTCLSFVLKSNAETLKIYPFEFELILTYELKDSRLKCGYGVRNIGESEMFFSIGGHPAFNVPIDGEGRFDDYFLQFSPRKSRLSLPLAGAYVDNENKTLGQTNTDILLTRELFKNDALIYETVGPNSYSIKSEKTSHSVTVSYDDMPFVGIWSPYPKEAPFVCIEPWCGIADTVQSTGDLVEKLGINQLDVGEQFHQVYQIEIS